MSAHSIQMIQIIGAVLFLFIKLSSVISDNVLYKDYKLYELHTTTRAEAELIQNASNDFNLDFWSPPTPSKKSSVVVSPWYEKSFNAFLNKHHVSYRILLEDLYEAINHETFLNKKHIRKRRNSIERDTIPAVCTNETSFEYFWSLNEIYKYLDLLNKKYPDLVQVMDYGKTHENRTIKVITISTNGVVNGSRPVVLVDGGIHAREWASHMAVMYLVHQLVEHSEDNMDLLNNTDWVIMPVVNPDGYEYTQIDRLWRKNRAPINNSVCVGADLNRNFPIGWRDYGSKCSVGYAGLTPASELETQAVMKLMEDYKNVTKIYLTVHSCGDLILYPYGYKYADAWNKDQMQALGEKAAEAVRAIGGPKYSVGSAATLLYPANGSDDYIYDQLKVQYAYTLELSCSESNSSSIFIISVAEMKQINREAFEMFKVFGKFAGEQTFADG